MIVAKPQIQVYRIHVKRQATCPHCTFTQNFTYDHRLMTHLTFAFPLIMAGMQPWIHVGVELFTRPFLPLPFLTLPTRKCLRTKLGFYMSPLCQLYQRVSRLSTLRRIGADTKYMQCLKRKPYNFATNMLKAYLSAQPFSFSAFMISKTHSCPKASRKTAKHKS